MAEKKFNESIVNLSNQKILTVTGVESVHTMNPNQVLLTALGKPLMITGENMEIEKLDVDNGILKIKGLIEGLKYNQKKENILKRIFK